MTHDDRRQETARFAAQVLGLDGVSNVPPPENSLMGRLHRIEAEYRAEGRSSEEIQAVLQAVILAHRARRAHA